jgi:ferritin-like metal-binding protein YciE
MAIETLEDLFHHELSDIYNAEKQLTKALPKMAKAAYDESLKAAFEKHLGETEDQIAILDQVFELCDCKPQRIKCEAMEGLIEEGKGVIEDIEQGPIRDVALIAAAQKVEHYEISGYGTLCALAAKLGYSKQQKLLHKIMEQERKTDEALTSLAEGGITDEAMAMAA